MVSVVIPAYNHEKFVDEAVMSVLTQSYQDWELVIINDGSTDGTDAKLRAYADERIRYFSQENSGAPATINRGISLARGRYVSILNSDDVYHPNRIGALVQRLESDASLDAAFSHLEFVDDEGALISRYDGLETLWEGRETGASFKEAKSLVLHLLAGNFVCTTSNLFCRREVFARIGGFQDFRYVHDYEFLLRLCLHCRTEIVAAPLVKYRLHAGNTIKESEPATDFERGVVLTKFLLDEDLSGVLPDSDPHTTALEFMNSLDARNAERMVMTLLLFVAKGYVPRDFVTGLRGALDSPFRSGCLRRFETQIDAWRSSQEAWAQWREANARLAAARDENKALWERGEETAARLRETTEALAAAREENERLFRAEQEAGVRWNELNEALSASREEAKRVWEDGQAAWARWREANDALVAAKSESERLWADGQRAWKEWQETNERLLAVDRSLNEANEEKSRIWGERQEAFARVEAVEAKLVAAEAKLHAEQAESAATRERLTALNELLRRVMGSWAWRLGRLVTWPARGVLRLIRARERKTE